MTTVIPNEFLNALYASIARMLPDPSMAEQAFRQTLARIQEKNKQYEVQPRQSLVSAFTVARNECVTLLLEQKKNGGNPEQKRDTVLSILHLLAPKQRVLAELIYVRKFTLSEVAVLLHVSDATIAEQIEEIKINWLTKRSQALPAETESP